MAPHLARIRLYPIKSLGPVDLDRVRVREGAGLDGDRQYALFDPRGRVLNTKRLRSAILAIHASYSDGGRRVELRAGERRISCDIAASVDRLGHFFGEVLGEEVVVGEDPQTGFFDDLEATGPTVLGSGSIATVAHWFGLGRNEVRRRFRANLEIAGIEPFEEDLLFGRPGEPREFRIGDVGFLGTNPCSRCIVPRLDSSGREQAATFTPARFARLRERHSRADSELASYGHFFRLSVNTLLMPNQGGRILSVGDRLLRP